MGIQSVTRVQIGVEHVPTAVQCNVCGRVRSVVAHGVHQYMEDMHVVELGGGYGDRYPSDLETLTFVTCGDCLRAWTRTFRIPPESHHAMTATPYPATWTETDTTWTIDGSWAYPEGTTLDWDRADHVVPPDDVEWPTEGVFENEAGGRVQVLKSVLANPEAPMVVVVYRDLFGGSTIHAAPLVPWLTRFRPLTLADRPAP